MKRKVNRALSEGVKNSCTWQIVRSSIKTNNTIKTKVLKNKARKTILIQRLEKNSTRR